MPNRILKESICRSVEINSLSWFEEILFYRLIVCCDDYGRFDGRTAIIKGLCFPLKDITKKDIEKALNKLSAVGLVKIYNTNGQPYLQLVTWERHQNIRAKKSKYPSNNGIGNQMNADVYNCNQMNTDVCNCSRNPIQSESESESNSNIYCSEPKVSEQQPVITLELNTGEEYGISSKDISEWTELYPAVDVMQCLRNMKGWLSSNPTKRKTSKGIRRFITRWLQKEQDNGGTRGYNKISQTNSKNINYDEDEDFLGR